MKTIEEMNTNETLISTLDIMRAIAKNADIKISRGFTDFLADRIIQASTMPSLLAMAERLAATLHTELNYIGGDKIAAFMRVINSGDEQSVLSWLREYPRIAAMILKLKDQDYEITIADMPIQISSCDKGTAISGKNTYDIKLEIECLSPLSHGADIKAGNATLFRRAQVMSTTNQVLSLPFYAGNALRGKMRDLLAADFLENIGLKPNKSKPPCSLWFFHALYAGGALEENSEQAKTLGKKMGANGNVNMSGVHEFRDMIPMLSLLGTALGNRILAGRVNFADCRPVCLEWGTGAQSVGTLFEWQYLTRREDHEGHEQGDNHSMIANTECLKAGCKMIGGIDIAGHISDLEKSCLAKGLYLLQKHGYLGAENRRGFGKVAIGIVSDECLDVSLYNNFLNNKKSEILKYLEDISAIEKQGVLL